MTTIDERLDRLTERHEALVQYTELTAHENQARFTATVSQLDRVIETIKEQASNITALAEVAASHERRIDRLERRRPLTFSVSK